MRKETISYLEKYLFSDSDLIFSKVKELIVHDPYEWYTVKDGWIYYSANAPTTDQLEGKVWRTEPQNY